MESAEQSQDSEKSSLPFTDSQPGKEERMWALAAHLTSFTYFVGIPGFVGPLVIWLVKKDEMLFVAEEAKESLNFQISLFIYGVACTLLTLTLLGAFIGVPGFLALALLQIIFPIMSALKAHEGKTSHYPITLRLIS